MKLKKGDKVKVISGNDKGISGIITRAMPQKGQVLVEGVNLVKKHVKPSGQKQGGIIEISLPLNISKVMLICPHCGKPTKVAIQLDKKGKKYRICRKCKSLVDHSVKKK